MRRQLSTLLALLLLKVCLMAPPALAGARRGLEPGTRSRTKVAKVRKKPTQAKRAPKVSEAVEEPEALETPAALEAPETSRAVETPEAPKVDDAPGLEKVGLEPQAPASEVPSDGLPPLPAENTTSAPQAEDPLLQIGGELLLRGQARTSRGSDQLDATFTTPSIVETYLDARPNERLRGMVTGRLNYDPTLASTPGMPNPSILLDQLWLRFDVGRKVFFTVGKHKVKWGASQSWNPTDFLSPQRRDLLNTFDNRVGTDMLKVHVPWEERGWNFYALGLVDRAGPTEKPLRFGGAVRAEVLLGGAEVALSGVVRQGQRPQLGLDVTSALGDVDVFAELALRRGVDEPLYRFLPDAPADGPLDSRFEEWRPEGWLPAVSGGLSYPIALSHDDVLSLGAEYFYNSTGYTQPEVLPYLLLKGRYQPFYAARQYAAVRAQVQLSDGVTTDTFSLTTLANLADRSFLARVDAGIQCLNMLMLEFFVSVPFGRAGGEFRPTSPEAPGTPALFEAGVGLRVRI